MRDMDVILQELCAGVPGCIGAVMCDFEGETVVTALGKTSVPEEAEEKAREHVPKQMALDMPVAEFLIRLAGAEPCALLSMLAQRNQKYGAGALGRLELRYEQVELFVDRLPEDFYVVLVVRSPGLPALARRHLAHARIELAEHLR